MSDPFLSEIRLMSFGFAPKGWALCNGQLLPINQNQALFSLLGAMYGGDGLASFALPDLRGRTALHAGGVHTLAEGGGEAVHTLSVAEMPGHSHALLGTDRRADWPNPHTAVLAASGDLYHSPAGLVAMNSESVATAGGARAHPNRQPFLALNFCIALQGVFPTLH